MKLSEEAIQQLEVLQWDYTKKANKVLTEYATKNNPYKVGDIIKDHFQIGRIKKVIIHTYLSRRSISISYNCERLTKKLEPFKSGEEALIYGNNVTAKLN